MLQCFQNVALEKTLESLLDCKEIKPVSVKGNQPWIFIGRTDAEAKVLILLPPNVRNWLNSKDLDVGKDWRREEKTAMEDEMAGWHHWFNGHDLGKLQEMTRDREAWRAMAHGVVKSQTWRGDCTTTWIAVSGTFCSCSSVVQSPRHVQRSTTHGHGRRWQPTPIFLPGESHGQRSLVGYSPWGCKESNTAEWLTHTGNIHGMQALSR